MDDFCKKYSGKLIGVLGLGNTGISVIKYLDSNGFKIKIWDDSANIRKKNVFKNFSFTNLNLEEKLKKIDILFVSPGIKKDNECVNLARKFKKIIISDIDIFWNRNIKKNNYFIGVTGSNGKSTVTSLIYHIIKLSGLKSVMGGNIGIPVLNLQSADEKEIYVLELSSFQLYWINKFKPNVSILTNISPDHLDNHGSFDNYLLAKKKIFQNQSKKDIAIINIDNTYCNRIFEELSKNKQGPKIIPISIKKILKNGIYYRNGVLYDSVNLNDYRIGKVENFTSLIGDHNKENIVCAIAACISLSIPVEKITSSICSYKGLPHRLEKVSTFKNITFINDSKSTNIVSCIAAIKCFKNIIWIAGGIDKNEDLGQLSKVGKNILAGFFIGCAGEKFKNYYKKYFLSKNSIKMDKSIELAVNKALKFKKPVVILFSPACASFDQYNNFEKRGEAFVYHVKKLLKEYGKNL